MPDGKLLSYSNDLYFLGNKLLTENSTTPIQTYHASGSKNESKITSIPSCSFCIMNFYISGTSSSDVLKLSFNTNQDDPDAGKTYSILYASPTTSGTLWYYNNMWYGYCRSSDRGQYAIGSGENQSNFVFYVRYSYSTSITYHIDTIFA